MKQLYFDKVHAILFFLFIISGCTTEYKITDYAALYGPSEPQQRVLNQEQYQQRKKQGMISYHQDIKPILDQRCVACHACYDAPCQLKLSSAMGLDRGATKEKIYGVARLEPAEPTRLFIDARSTADWRKKNFYPVLNERQRSSQAAIDNSLLAKLLQLKQDNPQPEYGKLPNSFKLDIDRSLECPDIDEFAEYQQKHPMWGMPYAMPGLSQDDGDLILAWLQEGAKIDPKQPLSQLALAAISRWETYFNRSTLKEQLVSRYIYEHLFIGHIHFQGHPDKEFYRLVRSTTPPGQAIEEIASVRPFDDPGVEVFYYRFLPIESTIVDKIHFVYELSNQKMQRYEELFFQDDYTVTELPSYQAESAANPFKTYSAIPSTSRYRFLLDNAQYFISGFIKGPVCRGQIALNVIRDRFWVAFITPDMDGSEKIKAKLDRFLIDQDPTLQLPTAAGDKIGLLGWRKYNDLARKYLKNKDAFANQLFEEVGGYHLNNIWDGDGNNQNAALTVFRHFDSATVVKGFIGQTPLTGWILDYPLFERIHYLLVAGFNVYGTVGHQLATRMYMDFLRMEGENNFLRFMPAEQRTPMHNSWYKGLSGRLANFFDEPYYSVKYETQIIYQTKDYQQEFFQQIRQRLGAAAGAADTINRCTQLTCIRPDTSVIQQEVDRHMRTIASMKGSELNLLPEMSLIRIKTNQPEGDPVYTLLINKALENVAVMVAENIRRLPQDDTVTVVPGFVGSYPNFFFSVAVDQLPEFIAMIKSVRGIADKEFFYQKFGIRRTNPEIWKNSDWFNDQHKKYRGLEAGVFDLNRYYNL